MIYLLFVIFICIDLYGMGPDFTMEMEEYGELFPELGELKKPLFDINDNDSNERGDLSQNVLIPAKQSNKKRKLDTEEILTTNEMQCETNSLSVKDKSKGDKCIHCDIKIPKDPNVMKLHLKKSHHEEFLKKYSLKCEFEECDQYFVRINDLTYHLEHEHGKLRIDMLKAKKMKLAIEHANLRSLDKDEVDIFKKKTKLRKCPQCNTEFNEQALIKSHLMKCNFNMYKQLFPYTCDKCEKDFAVFGRFQKHSCKIQVQSLDTEEKKVGIIKVRLNNGMEKNIHYCCNNHPKKSFMEITDYKNHLAQCNPEELDKKYKFSCPHCPHRYMSKVNLAKHIDKFNETGKCS